MSSTLYFPIINYKYVRKTNIAELTDKICTQSQVDEVLGTVETTLNGFKQRKRIDQTLSRFSKLFPTLFGLGILVALISSFVIFKAGVFGGLCLITLSIIFLFFLIASVFQTSKIEQKYKVEIENILVKYNSNLESSGAKWQVGSNNILELNFKEAWKFDDYYDNDDDQDP